MGPAQRADDNHGSSDHLDPAFFSSAISRPRSRTNPNQLALVLGEHRIIRMRKWKYVQRLLRSRCLGTGNLGSERSAAMNDVTAGRRGDISVMWSSKYGGGGSAPRSEPQHLSVFYVALHMFMNL